MMICESYMFEVSVTMDMRRKNIIRELAVGKIVAHLCQTLIIEELKNSIEHSRVVTTLNIIKH